MSILTVTMNPSVDIAYQLPTFKLDDVNRVAKSFLDPSKLSFIVVGKPEGLSVTDSAKE